MSRHPRALLGALTAAGLLAVVPAPAGAVLVEAFPLDFSASGEVGDFCLDGLTVDFGDWWFNLRPSNTEPLLRLNLEARTREACDARTAEVLAHVRKDA